MKNKKTVIILVLIFLSIFTRFFNVISFYSETDDQLSISQLLKYDELNLYDIANDKISPSYNNKIKTFIRELEKKNNPIINFSQEKLSSVIFNMSPSKHSTFAPLQYILFGWVIDKNLNYDQLKLFSRLPSILFSLLTILFTFKICKRFVFENNILYIPVSLVIFSLPMIYISQRSYNYSAATFAIIFLTYLFLKEIDPNNKNRFIKSDKIDFFSNIKFSILLSLQTYLSYICLLMMPSFFFIKLIYNYRNKKKLFSNDNLNLIISGFLFLIFILPNLIHMFSLNLQDYGMTGSTAGNNMEYSIKSVEKSLASYLYFIIKNFYFIISQNISIVVQNSNGSTILHVFFLAIVLFGIYAAKVSNNKKYNKILTLFILMKVCWLILVLFNIAAYGPTRHLLIYTPIIAILFGIGIERIFLMFFNKDKLQDVSIITMIIFTIIFAINFSKFSKLYKDSFDEKNLQQIIKNYNVGLILNGNSHGDVVCLMKNINIKISSCPIRNSRHNNIFKYDEDEFKKLKSNSQSFMVINLELNSKVSSMIDKYNFKKSYEITDIKFYENSPLMISKYVPNYLKLIIYE